LIAAGSALPRKKLTWRAFVVCGLRKHLSRCLQGRQITLGSFERALPHETGYFCSRVNTPHTAAKVGRLFDFTVV
jgi:hypothetical protein